MQKTLEEVLTKGVELHMSGEFDLASHLYESVLKLQPDHADANHNMGLLKLDTGNDLDALPYLQAALQADTSIAQFWLSYTKALVKLEKLDAAARIIDLAKETGIEGEEFLKLNQLLTTSTKGPKVVEDELEILSHPKPNILDTLNLNQALKLAAKKAKEGNTEEAKHIYKDILDKFPKNNRAQQALDTINKPPEEIFNKLINLYNQGQLDDTVQQAQALTQQYPNAYLIWNILGAAAAQTGQLDHAINAFRKVISLNPNYADAYNNIANALKDQGKLDEAIEFYKNALAINPTYIDACYNMGNALREQGRWEEAIDAYKKALSLNPHNVDAHNNIGIALREQGKLDEAIDFYKKALSLQPNYSDALYNLGRIYWLKQDFTKAFELMEWRWSQKKNLMGTPLESCKPTWTRKDKNNEKVFVWKEQGIGDEIMFGTTLEELNRNSEGLIVECDKRLLSLYRRSFPKSIKFLDDRSKISGQEYDSQIAIGSLPKHFRLELNDFSKTSAGWLKADTIATRYYRKKLTDGESQKLIGISWFTKSAKVLSFQRNVSIDLFAMLLERIPAKFVNLQYGDTTEDILWMNSKLTGKINEIDELDLFNDIDGLAALISACDTVISVDNAIVHLAGALGVDTKVLLPFAADERWGSNKSGTYWYDSLQLYRQETQGDWSKPLKCLFHDVSAKLVQQV